MSAMAKIAPPIPESLELLDFYYLIETHRDPVEYFGDEYKGFYIHTEAIRLGNGEPEYMEVRRAHL